MLTIKQQRVIVFPTPLTFSKLQYTAAYYLLFFSEMNCIKGRILRIAQVLKGTLMAGRMFSVFSLFQDTGDHMGQATAQLNLAELSRTLGYPEDGPPPPAAATPPPLSAVNSNVQRRQSMEHLDLVKMTPDQKAAAARNGKSAAQSPAAANLNKSGLLDEEDFFDFISRYEHFIGLGPCVDSIYVLE